MDEKRSFFSGRVVKDAQPLVGVEKDEIAQMVSRIKRADAQVRQPQHTKASVRAEDLQWVEEWQLPSEVLDYFVIEKA